jgi:protein-L-isoaspartate(D-aspartate) O-methyltransferase
MLNNQIARHNMVTQQLRATGLYNERAIELFKHIPRENFVPPEYQEAAYADFQIPLGHGQIMFTPQDEGKVIESLKILRADTILEIGTGSGYLTAILASLGRQVETFEIFLDFAKRAEQQLHRLKIRNVSFNIADINHKWNDLGTYDVICVTTGLVALPEQFKKALAIGGRLFAIIGKSSAMQATLIRRLSEDRWQEDILFETVIPLMVNSPVNGQFNF